ncbi:MAG: FtsX-like permease family protein [Bacteroidota bacterium]|nr:FtsX-like permease family protein [Bacteroidota bacterium]
MNLPFFIAKRYLLSKKSHNAINIISGISVVGVCIGTMALVIVLSAFNGLTDLVSSLYNSFTPEIEITVKEGKTFSTASTEFKSLSAMNGIASYTEVMEGNALLKYNDKQCIATVKGVSEGFEKASGFDSLIVEGVFDLSKNNIVMGKGIGNLLQTGSNDLFTPVSIYAPKRGEQNSLNPEDALTELKVYPAGMFSINDEFDFHYLIMNIDKARELLDYPDGVTSVELTLLPGSNVSKVQEKIRESLGEKFVVKNRQEQNAVLYKTMKSEKLWTFIILVFILIVATFNVIGSLTMLIIEKKKDISILRNMGAGNQLIRKIFLFEGMMITLIGAGVGLFLGVFICWLQMTFSLVRFTEGYVVDAYPVSVKGEDILMILAVVLLIGFFAAWYPVRVFTKKHLMLAA